MGLRSTGIECKPYGGQTMDDLTRAKELLERAQPFLENTLLTQQQGHEDEKGGEIEKLSGVLDEINKFLMKAQEHP
jgi:hypothetical protein